MYSILQENCSKSRRFLGLRPRPRWEAYDAPRILSCKGLLAFGSRSFPPSALAISPTWTFWYLRIFSPPHGLKPNSAYDMHAFIYTLCDVKGK